MTATYWAQIRHFRTRDGHTIHRARGAGGYYVAVDPGEHMTSAVARVLSRSTFARWTLAELRAIHQEVT